MLNAITSRWRRGWHSTVLQAALCAIGFTLVGCGAKEARTTTPTSSPTTSVRQADGLRTRAPVLMARRAPSTRPSIGAAPTLAKRDDTAFDGPRYASTSDTGYAQSELSHATVRAALRPRSRRLRNCYEREREANPRLAGKLIVAWTVDARGSVKEPSVTTSTMANPALEACVVRELTRVSFPKRPDGPTRVEYPFVFRPN